MIMSLNLSLSKQIYSWRFNPALLVEHKVIKYITVTMKDFIETNDNGEMSDSTLWETLNVIREDILSYISAAKKGEAVI